MQKGFPVLEDVAPVAFVAKHLGAIVVIGHVDREPIPWTTRVAMTPREGQRQVLEDETDEVGVVARIALASQLRDIDPLVESERI